MNLLAFDTSTERLSVAVMGAAGATPCVFEGEGGAQASTTLIPAIHSLLAQAGLRLAELDAIVYGRGPGSFTGLRTACSVAQGLAFGSGRPVLGVETLMAVADEARAQSCAHRVVAVLDARMGQVYSAAYVFDGAAWLRQGEIALCSPAEVIVPRGFTLAGNAMAAYPAQWPGLDVCVAMPTATALLRIAPTLVAAGQAMPAVHATPLYIRDKVAQTTEEREHARAARTPAT